MLSPEAKRREAITSTLKSVGTFNSAFFDAPAVHGHAPARSSLFLERASGRTHTGSAHRSTVDELQRVADEDAESKPEDSAAARAYAWNIRALPALYFAVGVLNNVQTVAWRQFLINGAIEGHGLDPAEQAFLGGVIEALPWNLKIFMAFLSDVLPILGYRRLSYLLIGLLLQGGGWILLGLLGGAASLPMIAAQQFTCTMGQMMVGVMCDTLVVEGISYETGDAIGYLQTTCQIFFALGGLAGTGLAGALPQYAHFSDKTMFLIRGLAAGGLAIPALLTLKEKAVSSDADEANGASSGQGSEQSWFRKRRQALGRCCAGTCGTARDVWTTTTQLRVFCPLVFVFVFAAVPQSSAAFNTYLLQQTPLCEWDNSTARCLDHKVEDGQSINGSSGERRGRELALASRPMPSYRPACETRCGLDSPLGTLILNIIVANHQPPSLITLTNHPH